MKKRYFVRPSLRGLGGLLLLPFALAAFTTAAPGLRSGKPFDLHVHKVVIRDVNNNLVTGNYYLYIQTAGKFYVYDPQKQGVNFTVPIDSSSRLAFGYPKDRSMKACSFEVPDLYKYINGTDEYQIGITVLAHEGTGTVSTYKKGFNFAVEDYSADMKKFPVKNTSTTHDIAGIAFFNNTDVSQKASRAYAPMLPR